MSKPTKKPRRSVILLFLCWIAFYGASKAMQQTESLPEKFGAILVPVVLLASGTYYAFKDRNTLARVTSMVFLSLLVAGFVKGFAGAAG